MKPFAWIEEYINDKQKYIDTILENKKDDGLCHISKNEIAVKLEKSLSTVNKKIKAINKDELIIIENGKDTFKIKKENFRESKTVTNYLKLLKYFSIEGNYEKNEKEIIEETRISYETIHFFKSKIPIDFRKSLKEKEL